MNGTPNFENRTLYHGDNLMFLRGINTGTIDLIATDPPFNKGRDFHATPDSLAKGASFQDRWSWDDDVEQVWIDKLQDDFPDVYHVIEGSKKSYGDDMGAFLCFMGVRLLEMKRVLKDTGSIYLHCDPTASHYLKELMDAVFGRKNFRNEIIWFYPHMSNTKKDFARKHDIIFRYVKSDNWIFNMDDVREPYDEKTLKRYENPVIFPGGYKAQANPKGKIPTDVWQIPLVRNVSKEGTGYPTQKPLALYERIIKASSNPGDVVLDPFCGCATTCVAAELLSRQWIGIDLWDKAHDVVIDRLDKESVKGRFANTDGSLQAYKAGKVIYLKKPPERSDDKMEAVPFLTLKIKKYEKEDETAKLSNKEMKALLIHENGGRIRCEGCNRIFDHEAYLELDHRNPRSNGGANSSYNRVLLCSPCNKKKSNKMLFNQLVNNNRRNNFWVD